MQDKDLYEYSVIRVVPRVEREEFVNVGIILFSKRRRFLKAIIACDNQKILCLDANVDMGQIQTNLNSFVKICSCNKSSGRIGQLDEAERFRWLTAVRSSVIQTSRPHPGFSGNLEDTMKRLMNDLVL